MISHNLVDVFEVADRIVVLRLGRAAGDFQAEQTTEEHVVAAITGLGNGRDDAPAGRRGGRMSDGTGSAAIPAKERTSRVSRETMRRLVQGDLASLRVVIGLALIWAIFQFENDRFLSAQNLTNLMLQITATGLISIGVVYVLLLGEIDLSVGAVSGLAAAVMAVLNVQHGWSPYLAIAAAVAVGMAIGVLQGSLFSRFVVPSFVVTLAGLLAWQGALLQVLGQTGTINLTDPVITGLANTFYSETVGWIFAAIVIGLYGAVLFLGHRRRVAAGLDSENLAALGLRFGLVAVITIVATAVLNSDRGVPLAVMILLAFVVGMEYVVKRTGFGRHVFAVGGNAEAARRAGIPRQPHPRRGLRDLRHDGGDRRHSRRLATTRRQPELGWERTAAAGDRRAGDRGDQPLRRPGLGLDGAPRRPGNRLDFQRDGPAGAFLGGQVHGHRRRPAAGRDRRRHRPPATAGFGPRLAQRLVPARRALLGKQQRGADCAAEVAERGDADRRRPFVDEEVLVHLRGQRVHVALAEAHAEAAADDHRFGVEQVDRRGDPGAQRLDRTVDQLLGEVVAMVEGSLPDAAGQSRFLVLVASA